jgi:3-methyl-2-oxobutanoate hydroxymethyltransferase
MPQSVHAMGGFKVQGKGDSAAQRLVADARALQDAGAYAIVLEAIPPDVAEAVTRAVAIPTIGIGAGPSCDGQVLVCYDLLGMYRDLKPKFAKRFAEVGDQIVLAMQAYVGEVQERTFPAPEHTFKANVARAPLPVSAPVVELSPEEIPPHWQTH